MAQKIRIQSSPSVNNEDVVIKEELGKTAFESAVESGYEGTEEEFNGALAELPETNQQLTELKNFKGHTNPVDYIHESTVSQVRFSVNVNNYAATVETIEEFIEVINEYPYFELSQSGCSLSSVEQSAGSATKVIKTAAGGFLRLDLNGKKVTKFTGTISSVTTGNNIVVSVVSRGEVIQTSTITNNVADIIFNNLSCFGDLTLIFDGELDIYSFDIYCDEENTMPTPEYDGQRIIVRSELHQRDSVYVSQGEAWNEVYVEDGTEVIVKNEDYASYVKKGDTFDICTSTPYINFIDELPELPEENVIYVSEKNGYSEAFVYNFDKEKYELLSPDLSVIPKPSFYLIKEKYDFTDSQSAREAVPVDYRNFGLNIKYKLSNGFWKTETFIGSDLDNWSTANSWRIITVDLGNITNINDLDSITDPGKYEFTYTFNGTTGVGYLTVTTHTIIAPNVTLVEQVMQQGNSLKMRMGQLSSSGNGAGFYDWYNIMDENAVNQKISAIPKEISDLGNITSETRFDTLTTPGIYKFTYNYSGANGWAFLTVSRHFISGPNIATIIQTKQDGASITQRTGNAKTNPVTWTNWDIINTRNQISTLIDQKIAAIQMPEPLIYNINEMFDFPSTADFYAELHKSEVEEVRDMVIIRADDISGITADLTITPQMGFGSYYEKNIVHQKAVKNENGSFTVNHSVIEIIPETENTNCQIKIPAECNSVNLSYFVGTRPAVKFSYYIDTDGVYHPFSSTDTPIENFCNYLTSITINGIAVVKNTIREIVFGDDYDSITEIGNDFIVSCYSLSSVDLSVFTNVTSIGNYFLSSCTSLSSIDLSVFTNITSIGDLFLNGCTSLSSIDLSPLMNVTSIGDSFLSVTKITSIDLSIFANITNIGTHFLTGCKSLTSINLSVFTNVTSIGSFFLSGCTSLSSIQLDNVNWSDKTVGTNALSNILNVPERVLHADSNEIAQSFKNKVPNASNWTIQIN